MVILSNVEEVLTDLARQLFNRTIVAIWDDRCDVHSTLKPFGAIILMLVQEKMQQQCQPCAPRDLSWHQIPPVSIEIGSSSRGGSAGRSQLLIDTQAFCWNNRGHIIDSINISVRIYSFMCYKSAM